MPALPSVDTHTPAVVVPDTPGSLWSHSFPSAELVSAGAAMFHGHRVEDRQLGITLDGHRWMTKDRTPVDWDREMVEGPRFRVMVSPGTVSIRYQDPARAERAAQRAVDAARSQQNILATLDPDKRRELLDKTTGAVISQWSSRSRSRMVQTLAELDWAPMFTTDELPAMITLTYPGDWETVAPNSAAARRHLLLFRKRYERAWGRKIIGVWKREFQRRGAPHFHLLMVPPSGLVNGQTFREWLGPTWAHIVAHPDPEQREANARVGTGVDYADGLKARDPRSVGVYFSKHGSFAAKDYQNDAPQLWVDAGSVGRYWGVWGLSKAVAGTFIAPEEATAALRTMRRLSRAQGRVARVPVWRYRTVVDPETGEVAAKWRRSTKLQRVYRCKRGDAGYLVVPDGPGLAGALARHLDRLRRPETVMGRSGAGPIGFLP